MKLVKKLLAVIVFIIAIIIGVYAYFGGFDKLNFKVANEGGETIVYREMIGDYSKSGDLMKAVNDELVNDYDMIINQNIGIYYDNPDEVVENKMRSDIGCIVNTDDVNKLSELSKSFLVKKCPKQEYLSVQLPYKGFFSIMIGIFRVYPAMDDYLDDKGYDDEGPIMEIYDLKNKTITYRKAINKD